MNRLGGDTAMVDAHIQNKLASYLPWDTSSYDPRGQDKLFACETASQHNLEEVGWELEIAFGCFQHGVAMLHEPSHALLKELQHPGLNYA